VRFVDVGKIVTTAGVSAGIDGALHVVDRLSGRRTATWAANGMEYKWNRAPEPEQPAKR
jgi:transcriptional regulator GlxA family with amidase domain